MTCGASGQVLQVAQGINKRPGRKATQVSAGFIRQPPKSRLV
jgi:hypothetical protein